MAAPDSTNPYAAPSDLNLEGSPANSLWQVHGIHLMVADGAMLPKIDLETGSENPSLEEKKRQFTKVHWASRVWFLLCTPMIVGLSFIRDEGMKWDQFPPGTSIAVIYGGAFILLSIVAIFLRPLNQRVTFTTCVDRRTERLRHRNKHIRGILYLLCIAALTYPLVSMATRDLSSPSGKLLGGVVMAATGMLALGIWQYYDRPKIHMTLEADGWLKLHGVHFNAIRRLETWTTRPPEAL